MELSRPQGRWRVTAAASDRKRVYGGGVRTPALRHTISRDCFDANRLGWGIRHWNDGDWRDGHRITAVLTQLVAQHLGPCRPGLWRVITDLVDQVSDQQSPVIEVPHRNDQLNDGSVAGNQPVPGA